MLHSLSDWDQGWRWYFAPGYISWTVVQYVAKLIIAIAPQDSLWLLVRAFLKLVRHSYKNGWDQYIYSIWGLHTRWQLEEDPHWFRFLEDVLSSGQQLVSWWFVNPRRHLPTAYWHLLVILLKRCIHSFVERTTIIGLKWAELNTGLIS